MNKRRPGIVLAVVAVALLAVVVIIRLVHSGGAEGEETAPLLPCRRPQPRPYAFFLRGALGLRNRLQGGV